MSWFDRFIHRLHGHSVRHGVVYRRSEDYYADEVAVYFERPSRLILLGHELRGRLISHHGNGRTIIEVARRDPNWLEIGRYVV